MTKSSPSAGGALIALGALGGAAIGFLLGEATPGVPDRACAGDSGFARHLVAGLAPPLARLAHLPDDAADHLDRAIG